MHPRDGDDPWDVFDNAAPLQRPAGPRVPDRRGDVLFVFSGKGGVGKTTLALGLAQRAGKQLRVVLVDANTASASEIVTAALQDHHRATVVGTHTFGKGVFQEEQGLSNGGALDITVGEYFTPSGHNLGGGGVKEGAGLRPDIYAIDNPHTHADEALAVALATVAAEVK